MNWASSNSDQELIFFASKEDLLEKIRYFKEHDDKRQEVAKNGWLKAHNCFNEKLVTKYMIEATLKIKHTENYAWPTTKY